jgi:hypothetical protein
MHPDHGKAEKEFANEIAIAYRINAVLTEAGETEFPRDQLSIQNNGRSSERAGTKRENVRARKTIPKAIRVAFKCFDFA